MPKVVKIIASPDANFTSAMRLDLVFLYDASVLEQLPPQSRQWFEADQLLINKYRGSLSVRRLEVVPSDATLIKTRAMERRAEWVLLYADFLTGAAERLELPKTGSDVEIQVTRDGVRLNDVDLFR